MCSACRILFAFFVPTWRPSDAGKLVSVQPSWALDLVIFFWLLLVMSNKDYWVGDVQLPVNENISPRTPWFLSHASHFSLNSWLCQSAYSPELVPCNSGRRHRAGLGAFLAHSGWAMIPHSACGLSNPVGVSLWTQPRVSLVYTRCGANNKIKTNQENKQCTYMSRASSLSCWVYCELWVNLEPVGDQGAWKGWTESLSAALALNLLLLCRETAASLLLQPVS